MSELFLVIFSNYWKIAEKSKIFGHFLFENSLNLNFAIFGLKMICNTWPVYIMQLFVYFYFHYLSSVEDH